MPLARFRELKVCALCQTPAHLCNSHILPDFLYRRLRESSGRFFSASRPNRPEQRGTSVQLLCADCEQRFSRAERHVQRTLFPKNKNIDLPIDYGPWMLEFGVSVSWRALTFLKLSSVSPYEPSTVLLQRLLSPIPGHAHADADRALDAWRSYLLGKSDNIGPFEQHLFCLNGKNFEHEASDIVGFTAYEVTDAIGIFSQLGPLCLLGLIHNENPEAWQNTKIAQGNSALTTEPQKVPQTVVV